jgi:predicted PurR-regulated permease PerM
MTRQQIFAICFLALLLFLLYQIFIIFRPFLIPILWAGIIARLTFPLQRWLSARLRWFRRPEVVAAAILTFSILLVGVIPVVYLTFLLVQETGTAYDAINAWFQSGGLTRLPESLGKLPIAGGRLQEWLGRTIVANSDFAGSFFQGTKIVTMFVLGQVTDFAKNAFQFTMAFLVMMFTLFFFYKDGPRLYRGFYKLVPLAESHKAKFFARLDQTTLAVVAGMVITALTQGLLAGLAYWLLGVPFPLVFTALTALTAFIPLGGTALIWVPVSIYLFVVAPVWKGVVMLAWGIGVVTTVDNVLKPLLIGRGAQLPTLFLFFSILGGLAAYGFIGLFLGPILLAILMTAIEIYREEYEEHPASQVATREKAETVPKS